MAQNPPTQSPKKYPYRKAGIVLIVVAVILGVVGFFLMPTDEDGLAAALVAWLPGGLALLTGLFFVTWDGKGGSDTGMSGPL